MKHLLTQSKINKALKSSEPALLRDGEGLHLSVKKSGRAFWHSRFFLNNKQAVVSLGRYDFLPLKEAREKNKLVRYQVYCEGVNPIERKRLEKNNTIENNPSTKKTRVSKDSFFRVSQDWFSTKYSASSNTADATKKKKKAILSRLNKALGGVSVGEINKAMIRDLILEIQNSEQSKTVAKETLFTFRAVINYAIAYGHLESDCSEKLEKILIKHKGEHFASLVKTKDLKRLLSSIYSEDAIKQAGFLHTMALRLMALVFVRNSELRLMKWEQIDFKKNEWRFVSSKTNTDLIVPLSTQAIAILNRIRERQSVNKSPFVFATKKGKPIAINSMNRALLKLGFSSQEMTVHGFRSIARTHIDEHLKIRVDAIEMQLSHKVKGLYGRAYNRTQLLNERKNMMQSYSDYLMGLIKP